MSVGSFRNARQCQERSVPRPSLNMPVGLGLITLLTKSPMRSRSSLDRDAESVTEGCVRPDRSASLHAQLASRIRKLWQAR